MVVWLSLTALVSWQVWNSFDGIKDGERVAIVGTFLAWMTVTTAIQKALKPHRGNEEPHDEGIVERVVTLLEKAANRFGDR